jgi:hypothetical protein
MSTEDSTPTPNPVPDPDAAKHIAEAHRLLNGMRLRLEKHPDLEEAIANLEMALSILTTKTAGLL